MKAFLILLISLSLWSSTQAQGLYRGGKGGGWASVAYQNSKDKTVSFKIVSSTGQFLNTIELPASPSMKMRVYDCLGRKMEESSLTQSSTKIQLTNAYARGIYIVAIENWR